MGKKRVTLHPNIWQRYKMQISRYGWIEYVEWILENHGLKNFRKVFEVDRLPDFFWERNYEVGLDYTCQSTVAIIISS